VQRPPASGVSWNAMRMAHVTSTTITSDAANKPVYIPMWHLFPTWRG
jgi:hypothetical protein